MKMREKNFPKSLQNDIIIQELADELLIYNTKTNRAHCLNQTARLIWDECDGAKTISEISRAVSRRTGAKVGEDLIWFAVERFKQDGLLANADEVILPEVNYSRREAVRRVGLAAVVALPAVTSIVAPSAAMALSLTSCNTGTSCTCSVGNNSSFNPQLCRTVLGGTSNCNNALTCDCLVVGGVGSTGGTCQL